MLSKTERRYKTIIVKEDFHQYLKVEAAKNGTSIGKYLEHKTKYEEFLRQDNMAKSTREKGK